MYLETVVAREDFAKEVQLLSLGDTLVGRYRDIFTRLYAEDRNLTIRRGFWGFALGLISMAALYAAYAWIAYEAIATHITLGEMTMYLMVFKQGQSAFSAILSSVGGMYEDNLYLSNLYEFLAQDVGTTAGVETSGPDPSDGIRFEKVSFVYPDSTKPAVSGVTFHLKPGRRMALVGHNGSGKTTLVKLLTRLYTPSSGRITLDGLDLQEWEPTALRRRIGVIFQDFVKYQFTVGKNIGVGDVTHLTDEQRWSRAAEKGLATEFISELDKGWHTQLGRWFKDGRELSIGQWQKIALSRAFMQEDADILVLDEPTSAMDAEAESQVFQRLTDMTDTQMAILISHRFSTVRMADDIVVLDRGEVVEQGTHETLMAQNGRYAHLFTLQAKGYR
jgi:ABC-type multidrug transport system fused ATPase/permease subunit